MRDVENVKPTALAKVGNNSQLIDIKDTDQTRVLCILLTLNAVVSYRSVPRILELFKSKTNYSVGWVPHFFAVKGQVEEQRFRTFTVILNINIVTFFRTHSPCLLEIRVLKQPRKQLSDLFFYYFTFLLY